MKTLDAMDITISDLMRQPLISPSERIIIENLFNERTLYDGDARSLVTTFGSYFGNMKVFQIKPYHDLIERDGLLILV